MELFFPTGKSVFFHYCYYVVDHFDFQNTFNEVSGQTTIIFSPLFLYYYSITCRRDKGTMEMLQLLSTQENTTNVPPRVTTMASSLLKCFERWNNLYSTLTFQPRQVIMNNCVCNGLDNEHNHILYIHVHIHASMSE